MTHAITPDPAFKPAGQETNDVARPFASLWLSPTTHVTVDVTEDAVEYWHLVADHARWLAYKTALATRAAS